MNHKCMWDDYDHLPCKIVPLILGFPSDYTDQLFMCAKILEYIASINGVTEEYFEAFCEVLGEQYIGPCPENLSEELIQRAKVIYE